MNRRASTTWFAAVLSAALTMGPAMIKTITKTEVICFGDSITHGAKVNGHSWVYFLAESHYDIRFINEGRNGRKTSDREEILPILKKYPDARAIMIFLGVNDLKDGNDSMVSICVRNVDWMIKTVRAANPDMKIVVLSPCEIDLAAMSRTNIRKKYNQNTLRSLNTLDRRYKALAMKDSVDFVSLLHAVSAGNYVDGLHPNLPGQQQIAKMVWSKVGKLFN